MNYHRKTNLCKILSLVKESATRAKDFICMLGSHINIWVFVMYTIACVIMILGALYLDLKVICVEQIKDFSPDFNRNYIYMPMFFGGYCACIWKKRQAGSEKDRQMDTKKKIWLGVLIFVHICVACLGILFIMGGVVDGLWNKSWESYYIKSILVGAGLLIAAVLIWLYLLKCMVYIWYPVSSYCALYVWHTGNCVGGLEGAGAIVAMLGIMIIFGIIECSITVFFNLRILKRI